MPYRLFGNHNEVLGTYPSLESCQQHARSDNRNDIRWQGPADTGPQGNGKHWYGYSEKKVLIDGFRQPEREYLIVEWPESSMKKEFKLIDFEDFNGCGPIYPHEPGYDTVEEGTILYHRGDMPVYSAYKKKADKEAGQTIQHPIAVRSTIVGEVIKPGTVLQATDVFASTTGKWEVCPCPGVALPEGLDVLWVRPTENK